MNIDYPKYASAMWIFLLIRHSIFFFQLFGLETSLEKEGENLKSELSIIKPASFTGFMKSLMLPEKWTNCPELKLKEYTFECTNISLHLCEVRFLAAIAMYSSWTIKYLNTIGLQKLKTAVQVSQAGIMFTYIVVVAATINNHNLNFWKIGVKTRSLFYLNFRGELISELISN